MAFLYEIRHANSCCGHYQFFFQNTKKQILTITMTTNRNSYKKYINAFNTIPLIMPFLDFYMRFDTLAFAPTDFVNMWVYILLYIQNKA